MSRKVPLSLPSRNATSGSISSDDASELAFFAMRCDSTASWFAYSISRRLPPPCAICADACCARSSSALLPVLSASRPLASDVRLVSFSSRLPAAVSTRSQRDLTSFSSLTVASSCATSSVTPRVLPPLRSASRSVLNRSRLSLTAENALVWPCAASALPRASRCESICISVAVAEAAAPCDDCRAVEEHHQRREQRNVTIRTPSVWNCLTTGRLPISGQLARHRHVGGRRAQLLHDRHGGERVVAHLHGLGHLDLRRRHVEIDVAQRSSPSRRRTAFRISAPLFFSPWSRTLLKVRVPLKSDREERGIPGQDREVDLLPCVAVAVHPALRVPRRARPAAAPRARAPRRCAARARA